MKAGKIDFKNVKTIQVSHDRTFLDTPIEQLREKDVKLGGGFAIRALTKGNKITSFEASSSSGKPLGVFRMRAHADTIYCFVGACDSETGECHMTMYVCGSSAD
jgi:hypothetical protein